MKKIFTLIISLILSLFVISYFNNRHEEFENLALGQETKPYFASKDSLPIHIEYMKDFFSMQKGWEKRGKKDIVLCLGNSQSHSINQMKESNVTYIKLLSDSLEKQGKDVLAITIPNISLQEMALSFEYALNKLAIKYVILPVFMDVLREDGIRADVFFENLIEEKFLLKDSSLAIVRKINKELSTPSVAAQSEIAALRQTTQEKVESYLNSQLDQNFQIWRNRPQIRGEFFTTLYTSRNTILGIDAQTKRKMIPKRYQDNFEALNYILTTCERKNIKSLIYIPPIRNDVEVPYDLKEYENFKTEVAKTVKKYANANYLNLENIVPGKYWGVKNSTNLGDKPELDFMHFQYEGHKLLFQYLYTPIKTMLEK